MTKLEYLLKQYETILDWYKQSEDKSKFLVTLNTLVVGSVNGLIFVGADKIRVVRDVYTGPVWVLLGLSAIALVGSYLFILRAMWPRHHTRDLSLKPYEKLWFFGDVASLSRQEHQNAVADWTPQNLEATMVAQNYILSNNVWIKHDALNWAIALTIAAILFLFGLGLAYGIGVANSALLVPFAVGSIHKLEVSQVLQSRRLKVEI